MWCRCGSECFFHWDGKSCGIIVIPVSFRIILIEIERVEIFCDFCEFVNYWNWKSCGIIAIAVSFGIISIEIERVVELLWFRWVLELFELKLKELWNYWNFGEFGNYFNWNWTELWNYSDFGKFGNYVNWNWKSCGIIVISVSFGIILIDIERVV